MFILETDHSTTVYSDDNIGTLAGDIAEHGNPDELCVYYFNILDVESLGAAEGCVIEIRFNDFKTVLENKQLYI